MYRRVSFLAIPIFALTVFGAQGYQLGPDDEVIFRSVQVKELADKTFRVDNAGDMNLPLIGKMHADGLPIEKLEAEVNRRLQEYYVEPGITASIAEYRKRPVSVIGAVGTPGMLNIRGEPPLMEVLSQAGGLRPDAGPIVRITRLESYQPLPLPGTHKDQDGNSVAEIELKALFEAQDSSLNIRMKPHDVVTVTTGQSVYVVGTVKRAGGFPLNGKQAMSVLEALSLAGGLDVRAASKNARILRAAAADSSTRQEVAVDLSKILKGAQPDQYLSPTDILFVPNSAAKNVTFRTIEAALQIGTGMLIMRPF
jgi:polysaccharide biosynthesis/export protein